MRNGTEAISRYREHRVLPYSAEQLFALVASVERYPEFLPGWHAARVLRREGNALLVEQLVGPRIKPWRFVSTVRFDRPKSLAIASIDGPFRRLEIRWAFVALPGGGCRVNLEAAYALRPTLPRTLVAASLGAAIRGLVTAFERRAHALYGTARRRRSDLFEQVP